VPGFDAFYGTAVMALQRPLDRVLDLGAGTGLMSAFVAERHPQARFELLDGSPEMLAEAEQRLGDRVAAIHVQDMADGLPDGPFDAVVSALAIHHLEDPDKRVLFTAVHERLRPGGSFVNAEQVAGPTPELTALYDERWASACRELGASAQEVAEAFERRKLDRCASVEDQLCWLREAGFATADCYYKDWGLAVLCATKGAAR
jgi:tRNA (cmo5U34)-methyltransferase